MWSESKLKTNSQNSPSTRSVTAAGVEEQCEDNEANMEPKFGRGHRREKNNNERMKKLGGEWHFIRYGKGCEKNFFQFF